jgi:GSH-dependent disulfide-bond oxidoreductase
MMFVASGIGPFTGQCVHFKHYAPEQVPYAIKRYEFEAWRHWKILDAHLAGKAWMLGDTYTRAGHGGVGLGARRALCAGRRGAGSNCRTSSACSTAVNERPAAQRAGVPEGPARLQDRDGRRGTPRDVPPSK